MKARIIEVGSSKEKIIYTKKRKNNVLMSTGVIGMEFDAKLVEKLFLDEGDKDGFIYNSEQYENLKEIIISKNINELQGFELNKKLERIIIEERDTKIHIYGFSNCDNLKEIIIKNGNKGSIEISGFHECRSLKKIELETNVIGLFGFNRCKNLKEITFKDGSQCAKIFGFDGCKNLKIFDFGKGSECKHVDGFSDCIKLKKLKIGKNVQYLTGFQNNYIEELTFEEGNQCKEIHGFQISKKITKLVIPKSVEKIRGFGVCDLLQDVTFEEGSQCKFIGGFDTTEFMVIPKSVTNIILGWFILKRERKVFIFEEGSKYLQKYFGIKKGKMVQVGNRKIITLFRTRKELTYHSLSEMFGGRINSISGVPEIMQFGENMF